jgi:hypothetical protein
LLSGCNENKDNKSTTPEIINYLSVKDVLANSSIYIDTAEIITIKGYYYTDYNDNIIEITDSAGYPGSIPSDVLFVDYSGVVNVVLNEGSKYLFSGVLQEYNLNPNIVILIVNKIELA